MDKLTLEYMQKRVEQGQKILNLIEQLNKLIDFISKANEDKSLSSIQVTQKYHFTTYNCRLYSSELPDVVPNITAAIVECARKEIERLEKEFAAL